MFQLHTPRKRPKIYGFRRFQGIWKWSFDVKALKYVMMAGRGVFTTLSNIFDGVEYFCENS